MAFCSGVSSWPCRTVWIDVWASFRYSDSVVMSMKSTVTLVIDLVTLLATVCILLSVPTERGCIAFGLIGSVSFAHLIPPGLPQSVLLHRIASVGWRNLFIDRIGLVRFYYAVVVSRGDWNICHWQLLWEWFVSWRGDYCRLK